MCDYLGCEQPGVYGDPPDARLCDEHDVELRALIDADDIGGMVEFGVRCIRALAEVRDGLLRADSSIKVARHMVEVCNIAIEQDVQLRRLPPRCGRLDRCFCK